MPYVNNKDADQPAHLHSLICTFVFRCLDSIIPLVSISEISSLYLASVAAQAGLSQPWDRFSRDVAQFFTYLNNNVCSAWAITKHPRYCKTPKNSDNRKNCCNYPKLGSVSSYYTVMGSKDVDGIANRVDPDQTAPLEEQSDLGLHCLPRPVCPKT